MTERLHLPSPVVWLDVTVTRNDGRKGVPPPTNSDGELEIDAIVLLDMKTFTSQRLVHFYPREPFEVDGITYHPCRRGCQSRPMIELLGEREG